jgi:hypothetical protein
MTTIETGSVVIVHCTAPREKLWGLLLRIDAVGAVIRGMDLTSVDDWIRQEARGDLAAIGPTTFLLPSHRLVRVDLDESAPLVDGYADRYRHACGRDVRIALAGSATDPVGGLPA